MTKTTLGTEITSQTYKGHPHDYTHNTSTQERNHIILQVNIKGIKIKLEELKLLIYNTHADVITIQETKLTHKAKTQKVLHHCAHR